jgi:hypothetical protein
LIKIADALPVKDEVYIAALSILQISILNSRHFVPTTNLYLRLNIITIERGHESINVILPAASVRIDRWIRRNNIAGVYNWVDG